MEIKKRILSNNIPVLFIDLPDATSSTFLVFYKAGARLDPNNSSGVAHLLEHSIFKGSSKFKSSSDISFAFENLGSQIDAGTSMEYTFYMVKSLPDHLIASTEILSDILLTATFPNDEIEKEKQVVLEEIRTYKDNPITRVNELFLSTLWKDESLGRYIAGTIESVSSLTRNDIEDYKSEYYLTGNFILVAAGNLGDHDLLEECIKKSWEKVKKVPPVEFHSIKPKKISKKLIKEASKLEQTHLVYGGYAPGLNDKHRYPFTVGAAMLGQGMGSRLFRSLREENPLCYYINAGYLGFTDTGAFFVKAGLNNQNIDFAREKIEKEISSVASGNFTDEELARAKAVLLSSLTFDLEGADDLSLYYATSEMLLDEHPSPLELEKIINEITKEDVVSSLSQHINTDQMLTAMIGA